MKRKHLAVAATAVALLAAAPAAAEGFTVGAAVGVTCQNGGCFGGATNYSGFASFDLFRLPLVSLGVRATGQVDALQTTTPILVTAGPILTVGVGNLSAYASPYVGFVVNGQGGSSGLSYGGLIGASFSVFGPLAIIAEGNFAFSGANFDVNTASLGEIKVGAAFKL